MNILVFVKQVPDTEALVEAAGDGLKVEEKYELSYFDSLAVEEALKIKEQTGGTVTAVTVGPERTAEVLRTCLALGADSVKRIWDEALVPTMSDAASDSLMVARVLAGAAKHLGFDLILCGKQALDDDTAAIGPMVSALLDIPFVTAVSSVSTGDGKVTVKREIGGAVEEISAELPALLSAEKGLNEPRQPQVMKVMKAARATIDTLDMKTLGIGSDAFIPLVEPVSFSIPDKARKVQMLKGEPEAVAGDLIEKLRQENKLF